MSLRLHSVLAAAAMPIILAFSLVALLMTCAVVAASPAPAIKPRAEPVPPAAMQARCSRQLAAIRPGDPVLARLERVYRRHVRFGPAGHNPFPHHYSNHDDILRARAQVSADDIVFMVYQLRQQTLPRSLRIVPVGVLAQFGPAALPCIAAAMVGAPAAASAILHQIRIEIEANQLPGR